MKSCHFTKAVGRSTILSLHINRTTWASPGENNNNNKKFEINSCFFYFCLSSHWILIMRMTKVKYIPMRISCLAAQNSHFHQNCLNYHSKPYSVPFCSWRFSPKSLLKVKFSHFSHTDLASLTEGTMNSFHVRTMGTSDAYTKYKPGIYSQSSLSRPFIYITVSNPLLQ